LNVARRRRWPLGLLGLVAVALAALTWVVAASRDGAGERGDAARDEDAAKASALGSSGADGAARRGSDSREGRDSFDGDSIAARRVASSTAPRDLDRRAIRKLEQQRRAAFWGVVLDPKGAPCAGATIFHGGEPVTTSDARGEWSIVVAHDVELLPSDSYYDTSAPLLAARKPGVGVAVLPLVGPSRQVDLRLQTGEKLRGRCIEHGTEQPVRNATLELVFAPDLRREPVAALRATTTADHDGDFEFGELPRGVFTMTGRADGFATVSSERLNLVVGDFYDVEFTATCHVTGRFKPWPPPGSPFREPPKVTGDREEWDSRGRIDRDGAFSVDVFGSDVALDVGSVALWYQWFDRGDAREFDLGEVTLTPPARAHGRVDLPADVLALGVEVVGVSWAPGAMVRVGRDGRFAFDALSPVGVGEYRFDAELGGQTIGSFHPHGDATHDRWNPHWFTVARGDDLELADFAVDVPTVLCGRVLDADGEPLAAHLDCRSPYDGSSEWVVTQPDGLYVAVGLQSPGAYGDDGSWVRSGKPIVRDVEVQARGHAPQRFRVEVPSGTPIARRDLRLASGSTLRGRAVDEKGEPLVGWVVRLSHESSGVRVHDVTGADGSFEIAGLAPWSFAVELDSPAHEHYASPSVYFGSGDVTLSLASLNKVGGGE
jgi:hypothetical protein